MSRKSTVTKELLLALLATGGILTVAAVAPGALGLFPILFKQKKYDRRQIVGGLRYAQSSNLVSLNQKGEMVTIALTKFGKKRVLSYQVDEMIIPKPKHWDGRWYLVIFDVPKKHNVARNALRDKLKLLGFTKLQESVWLHPFPCQKEIQFLRLLYGIEPFVKVLEVSNLPQLDQQQLVRRYHLQNN